MKEYTRIEKKNKTKQKKLNKLQEGTPIQRIKPNSPLHYQKTLATRPDIKPDNLPQLPRGSLTLSKNYTIPLNPNLSNNGEGRRTQQNLHHSPYNPYSTPKRLQKPPKNETEST